MEVRRDLCLSESRDLKEVVSLSQAGLISDRIRGTEMRRRRWVGKSYLSAEVQRRLNKLAIPTAILSLDDLYLPHETLEKLHQSSPDNPLLAGRGLPGTHDIALARKTLSELETLNDRNHAQPVQLPVYDKSAFSGRGDRSSETVPVLPPLDVVIIEGWMLGFFPIPDSHLKNLYESTPVPTNTSLRQRPFFRKHELDHLRRINELLEPYAEYLWPKIPAFIQLRPTEMDYTFDWRLEVRLAVHRICFVCLRADLRVRVLFAARAQHEGQEWWERYDGRAGRSFCCEVGSRLYSDGLWIRRQKSTDFGSPLLALQVSASIRTFRQRHHRWVGETEGSQGG